MGGEGSELPTEKGNHPQRKRGRGAAGEAGRGGGVNKLFNGKSRPLDCLLKSVCDSTHVHVVHGTRAPIQKRNGKTRNFPFPCCRFLSSFGRCCVRW